MKIKDKKRNYEIICTEEDKDAALLLGMQLEAEFQRKEKKAEQMKLLTCQLESLRL